MTISVLQQVVGTDSAAAGATAVVTLTVTAGNRAHVFITCSTEASIATPTSSPSQTWTLLDTLTDVGTSQVSAHYVSDSLAGGSTTITETFSGGSPTFRCIIAKEIGGTSGYDATAAAKNAQFQQFPTTGTDATTSNATPTLTAQPALLSGFSIDTNSNLTTNAGTGFTDDGASATIICRGESKRVTSTTGAAATFTATSNASHHTYVAAFLETAAGPTINTQPASTTKNIGDTATFTISATTSGGTLHYQWKLNGSNVGTDTNNYTTGTLALTNDGDTVSCDVSDDNGTTSSSTVYVRITRVFLPTSARW